jgi:short-subunit dehydrogenase
MNALIYGATGGIGQEICRRLSQKGTRLWLLGRSSGQIKRLAGELSLSPSQTLCIDSITSDENYQRLVEWLTSQNTRFQIGVHCVGYGCQKRTRDLGIGELIELLNVNLASAFSFYKAFDSVKGLENYDLIFFGSASTDQDWPKNSLYGASKAGLEYFARSLQKEIRQEGGRVWLYKPGSVNTGFFKNLKNHLPPNKMISAVEAADIVVGNLETGPNVYFSPISFRSD